MADAEQIESETVVEHLLNSNFLPQKFSLFKVTAFLNLQGETELFFVRNLSSWFLLPQSWSIPELL